MLFYSLVFVILAVLAAMFGFEIAATSFADLAKLGFSIFVVGFVVSLGMHLKRRV